MKALVFLLLFSALSSLARAEDTAKGFLVFEIDRYAYNESHTNNAETKQAFKVPLTEEFLSNFKNLPSQNSSGTGFCCSGGEQGNSMGNTWFMCWLNKTADNRWYIHMWANGDEEIDGIQITSRNPGVTQSLMIKKLQDLDMNYQVSYVNKYDGVNVSFAAKFMSGKEVEAKGNILTMSVKRADRSFLFNGDVPTNCPIKIGSLFQEG